MRFSTFCEVTKIEETLYALPFVLSGGLLALSYPYPNILSMLWIFPAFALARVSGMTFNQLIDRHIDARNPRTKNRVLPTSRAAVAQVRLIAWSSLSLFILVCLQINLLCALLSIVAASLIYIYSYLKRILASCHFILGAIHTLGVLMAFAALQGSLSLSCLFLALAAGCSIIGNDIIYQTQDYAHDVQHGIYNIPSRLGIQKSLLIAALIHLTCVLSLIGVGLNAHFPPFYYLVSIGVGVIFFRFHRLLRQQLKKTGSLAAIQKLFFLCTIMVSFSSLLFVTISVLWLVL